MAKGYFSPELFKFLSQLKKNNDRKWFHANKQRFEDSVRDPFLNFIEAAGPQLRKVSKHIIADPRPVGGSLFRIYRDVRFSKDKSPYKTNVGAHFRHAGKEVAAPSFYLHLQPGESFLAGGMYQPDSKSLSMVRDAIVDRATQWKTVLRSKPNFGEYSLVRPPRGFDAGSPFIEDIKRTSYISSIEYSEKQICSSKFMEEFISDCRSMNALMKFLADAAGVAW